MTITTRTVTTQAELDAALAEGVDCVDIYSPSGAWLEVRFTGSATVQAYGSAMVRARGSAMVRARDSATVQAYGSAMVRARDSATVQAAESATVQAYGSAMVQAADSATVIARGSAIVWATSRVAIHLHSSHATIHGGVLIDHTAEPSETPAWCQWHDVSVVDGIATLYKAVSDSWTTDHGTDYTPGTLPACDDWRDDNNCIGGLHFSPLPIQALAYHPEATRFVAVGVRVDELRPIPGRIAKAKAPRVVVACREVDIDGKDVIS